MVVVLHHSTFCFKFKLSQSFLVYRMKVPGHKVPGGSMGNDREERSRESCNPHSTALLVKDRKSEWLYAGVSKLCCCIVFCIIVYLKRI